MKKVFCVKDFGKEHELDGKPLIVAFGRNNKKFVVNLECNPSDRMRTSFDSKTNELVLRFKVFDNEFLAIGDAEGKVDTVEINKGETI